MSRSAEHLGGALRSAVRVGARVRGADIGQAITLVPLLERVVVAVASLYEVPLEMVLACARDQLCGIGHTALEANRDPKDWFLWIAYSVLDRLRFGPLPTRCWRVIRGCNAAANDNRPNPLDPSDLQRCNLPKGPVEKD